MHIWKPISKQGNVPIGGKVSGWSCPTVSYVGTSVHKKADVSRCKHICELPLFSSVFYCSINSSLCVLVVQRHKGKDFLEGEPVRNTNYYTILLASMEAQVQTCNIYLRVWKGCITGYKWCQHPSLRHWHHLPCEDRAEMHWNKCEMDGGWAAVVKDGGQEVKEERSGREVSCHWAVVATPVCSLWRRGCCHNSSSCHSASVCIAGHLYVSPLCWNYVFISSDCVLNCSAFNKIPRTLVN